jgi:hypothetical protein
MIHDYFDGRPVFEGTWTAITAAKGFDTNLLNVPKDATHWVRYTTGGTAALAVGETLTGGTSSATAVLVAQAVEVGTAGSSDTGILFLKSVSGTFEAETLTGGTSTGTVAIIQAPIAIPHGIVHPKAALIAAESFALNVTISGTTPTVTAGTNHGITIAAANNWRITGINALKQFKCINAVNASGAVCKYILYF